jgi:hypothetical protein
MYPRFGNSTALLVFIFHIDKGLRVLVVPEQLKAGLNPFPDKLDVHMDKKHKVERKGKDHVEHLGINQACILKDTAHEHCAKA